MASVNKVILLGNLGRDPGEIGIRQRGFVREDAQRRHRQHDSFLPDGGVERRPSWRHRLSPRARRASSSARGPESASAWTAGTSHGSSSRASSGPPGPRIWSACGSERAHWRRAEGGRPALRPRPHEHERCHVPGIEPARTGGLPACPCCVRRVRGDRPWPRSRTASTARAKRSMVKAPPFGIPLFLPGQVYGDDAVLLRQRGHLRRPGRVVTGPSVDQDQRARTRAGRGPVQVDAVDRRRGGSPGGESRRCRRQQKDQDRDTLPHGGNRSAALVSATKN